MHIELERLTERHHQERVALRHLQTTQREHQRAEREHLLEQLKQTELQRWCRTLHHQP